MSGSITGLRAHKTLELLRPHWDVTPDEAIEVWGPLDALQYDASGAQAIQQYRTLLVRRADQRWYFVRQVNVIHSGQPWTSPPMVKETSERDAVRWLDENGFALDPARHRSPLASMLATLLPWL